MAAANRPADLLKLLLLLSFFSEREALREKCQEWLLRGRHGRVCGATPPKPTLMSPFSLMGETKNAAFGHWRHFALLVRFVSLGARRACVLACTRIEPA